MRSRNCLCFAAARGRATCAGWSARIIGKFRSHSTITKSVRNAANGWTHTVYILLGTDLGGRAGVHRGARLDVALAKVVPVEITTSLTACESREDVGALCRVCKQKTVAARPPVVARVGSSRLAEGRQRGRAGNWLCHEIVRLERGLVVLEIIVGIAPLLGLVGTIIGMMTVFGDIGQSGLNDAVEAGSRHCVYSLRATLIGLLICIPSLIF